MKGIVSKMVVQINSGQLENEMSFCVNLYRKRSTNYLFQSFLKYQAFVPNTKQDTQGQNLALARAIFQVQSLNYSIFARQQHARDARAI